MRSIYITYQIFMPTQFLHGHKPSLWLRTPSSIGENETLMHHFVVRLFFVKTHFLIRNLRLKVDLITTLPTYLVSWYAVVVTAYQLKIYTNIRFFELIYGAVKNAFKIWVGRLIFVFLRLIFVRK